MDREVVLSVLVIAGGGVFSLLGGALPAPRRVSEQSALARERVYWIHLWAGVVPGLLVVFMLLGWSLAEPERAERVPVPLFALSVVAGAFTARALLRAIRAAFHSSRVERVAATVGLLRPRVVISQELRSALEPDALQAALEHELAHARHYDPLRLWIGQLIADLQGPWSGSRERFALWRESVELARDEEARRNGADGAALAAAVVAAAGLGVARSAPCGLHLAGPNEVLANRVRLLLQPLPSSAPRQGSGRRVEAALALLLLVGAVFGFLHGETLVRALLLASG